MGITTLPAWALWIQVLGIPLFGAIISGIGLRIAWLQKQLQEIRLQHDLYERRYRIYSAAKALLGSVQAHGCVNGADFQFFLVGTADAEFLFASNITEYLTELRTKAARMIYLGRRLGADNLAEGERERFVDEEAEVTSYFQQQFAILRERFRPFMQLDHKL
jgi:hypothetical protein